MSAYENRLSEFQDRLGYRFADDTLLIRALTHSSYINGRKNMRHNERLEFLGDRVLGLLTAERLFHDSNDAEGKLARRLNALVRKETCADIARDLNFASVLRISKSEEKQSGRDKLSILGDACEAVIAAIYLDGGLEAIKTFYDKHWAEHFEAVLGESAKDPKTELQERAVRYGFEQPEYDVLSRKGPDHKPVFEVEVRVEGYGTETAEGASKKIAERRAAAELLTRLKADHVR